MDAASNKEAYMPSATEFQENTKDPLVDFTVNDSTELWLIQWSKDQNPDFHGQELSLKLHHDADLGTFVGTSGKEYALAGSNEVQNATVFVSSASGTKIAGNISRRVSLVHFTDPSTLEETRNSKKMKLYQTSSAVFATPSRSSMPRNSHPASSRPKSSISGFGEPSQVRKKRHAHEPTRSSVNGPSQNSGRGHSGVSSSGRGHSGVSSLGQGHSATTSSGQGHRSKSKKKVKDEN